MARATQRARRPEVLDGIDRGTTPVYEHMFGTLPGPVAGVDDLITFCRLHLGEGDAERLVGWIAWRTGRNQAMAGSGPPLSRLEHALANWLDDERRALLLAWLRRRVAAGRPPVPR